VCRRPLCQAGIIIAQVSDEVVKHRSCMASLLINTVVECVSRSSF
jgi:hypothetical protein